MAVPDEWVLPDDNLFVPLTNDVRGAEKATYRWKSGFFPIQLVKSRHANSVSELKLSRELVHRHEQFDCLGIGNRERLHDIDWSLAVSDSIRWKKQALAP
ncbi:hypothetical protein D3C81_1727110 [compost metagenome]